MNPGVAYKVSELRAQDWTLASSKSQMFGNMKDHTFGLENSKNINKQINELITQQLLSMLGKKKLLLIQ